MNNWQLSLVVIMSFAAFIPAVIAFVRKSTKRNETCLLNLLALVFFVASTTSSPLFLLALAAWFWSFILSICSDTVPKGRG